MDVRLSEKFDTEETEKKMMTLRRAQEVFSNYSKVDLWMFVSEHSSSSQPVI